MEACARPRQRDSQAESDSSSVREWQGRAGQQGSRATAVASLILAPRPSLSLPHHSITHPCRQPFDIILHAYISIIIATCDGSDLPSLLPTLLAHASNNPSPPADHLSQPSAPRLSVLLQCYSTRSFQTSSSPAAVLTRQAHHRWPPGNCHQLTTVLGQRQRPTAVSRSPAETRLTRNQKTVGVLVRCAMCDRNPSLTIIITITVTIISHPPPAMFSSRLKHLSHSPSMRACLACSLPLPTKTPKHPLIFAKHFPRPRKGGLKENL